MTCLRGLKVPSSLVIAAVLAACSESPNDRLLSAAAHGDVGGVKHALADKADVNAMNRRGDTPLGSAAVHCNLDLVRTLLASGADVNKKSVDADHPILGGTTALILASGSGDGEGCPEVVTALLAAGADVNTQNASGSTALSMAAIFGEPEVAQRLLSAGADPNAGLHPPLDFVVSPASAQSGSAGARAAVAQLLREHGARSDL